MQTKMHFSAGKTRSVFSEQIRIDKKLHMSAVISASFLFVFGGLAVFPVANRPDDIQAANTISETTLAMTTEDIALTFDVDNPNGTFSASDPTEFTVITNNYSGYTLSISAKEDNANNSKLINDGYEFNSISSASSQNDFTNGTWGYRPSKINSAANTSYLPAPSYAGDTLDVTAAANNQANTYSIALGAKADYTLPAGEYNNTFVITAIANPVGYQISYSENTEDTVTNMPSAQSGDVTATEVAIASEVPVRSGYVFKNWCSGAVTTTIGVDSCDSTVYQPEEVLSLSQVTTNSLALKAMWETQHSAGTFERAFQDAGKQTTVVSGNRYYLMQDMTIEICEDITVGQEAHLVDSRDNTIYSVGKLADERCWLLDNLALDLTDNTVKANLTSNTTNASDVALNYLKNGGGTTSDQYPTAGVNDWDSSYSFSAPLQNKASKDSVVTTYEGTDEPMKTQVTAGDWKVGIYYNFCAASAGTYCYGNGTETTTGDPSSDLNTSSHYNIDGDICPKGWRMPTSFSNRGDVASLVTAISGGTGNITDSTNYTIFRNVLHLPLSGYISAASANYQGSRNYTWSASFNTYSSTSGSAFSTPWADASSIDINRGMSVKTIGLSVRCIVPMYSTVSFDANGGSGTMNPQTTANDYVQLQNNTFTMVEHYFSGWNTKRDGSGNSYSDNDKIHLDGDTTLYAQWARTFDSVFTEAGKNKLNGYYKLQDMTASICGAVTVGEITSLIDTRDNTVYNVGKQIDGKCWLLDNLALDLTDSSVQANLAIDNTNVTDATALVRLKSGGGTTSDKYPITGVDIWGESSSYSQPLLYVANKDYIPTDASSTAGQWKAGIYYNFCAASAGTYCYGNGPETTGIPSSDPNTSSLYDIDGDICPKGWHMPTGTGDGEVVTLAYSFSSSGSLTISSIRKMRPALRLPFSGFYNGSSLVNIDSNFQMWTSTYKNSSTMNSFSVSNTSVSYQDWVNQWKSYDGRSVRCVADE